MKKMYILATLLLVLPFALRADANKAANDLLDLIQFEKTMNDTMDVAIEMMKQSNPEMGSEEELTQFYQKYLSSKSLRNDVVALYTEVFTEEEINDIIAFYKTPTGQKAIHKMPEVTQRAMLLGQQRVIEHQDELVAILNEALKEEAAN